MTDQRTIVIVGGVAGGASAATRARRRNETARIVLLEKDDHVSFANCGLPYYVGQEIVDRQQLLVASAELLRTRFRIDVRIRHEALEVDPEQHTLRVRDHVAGETYVLNYDKLILSPGATPLRPPLPGIEAENVLTLRNLHDADRIKARVDQVPAGRAVVVGAGYIGLEMVEQLVRRKTHTSLVELQPQILPLFDPEMAEPLAEEIRRHGVDLYLGDGIKQILVGQDGQAKGVELASGARLDADLVVLGIGVRPLTILAQHAGLAMGATGGIAVNANLQTSHPDIYAVGDAVEYVYGPTGQRQRIALAGPANRAGRLAGEHAATGHCQPMSPVWGTSIVRAFGMTAGLTGLTQRAAHLAPRTPHAVTIVANHHAGYYPGASPLTIKLLYDPSDGRVLGAQVVGHEGVDKRVDVIATALHFKANVYDLAGLDLAYAPPFGAAKDPVHIAAFAACNELQGSEVYAPSDADLSDVQVLDVRSADEMAHAPLTGVTSVVHIPLDQLRERLAELDPTRPTVVSCGVGARAHVATSILRQSGFADVRNLSGGATVRRRAVPEP